MTIVSSVSLSVSFCQYFRPSHSVTVAMTAKRRQELTYRYYVTHRLCGICMWRHRLYRSGLFRAGKTILTPNSPAISKIWQTTESVGGIYWGMWRILREEKCQMMNEGQMKWISSTCFWNISVSTVPWHIHALNPLASSVLFCCYDYTVFLGAHTEAASRLHMVETQAW